MTMHREPHPRATRRIAPLALLAAAALALPAAAKAPAQTADPAGPSEPAGTTPAAAQETPPTSVAPASDVVHAADLTGMSVQGVAGQSVGTVKELVFAQDGDVVVLLHRPDGRLSGVPLDLLDPVYSDETEDGRHAIERLDASDAQAKLDDAPTAVSPDAVDRAWVEKVEAHYAAAATTPGGEGEEYGPDPDAKPDAEPARQDGPDAASRPACLDKLVGIDVRNTKGDELGKLSGIAVDVSDGKVAYAIVAVSSDMFGLDQRHHGAPWNALRLDADRKVATLNVDKTTLEDMPGIDMEALPPTPDLRVAADKPVSLKER